MKKRLALIQAHIEMGNPDANYRHILELMKSAMQRDTDIIVLPELWDIGFFPKENLRQLADKNGQRVQEEIGGFASKYKVNVVAGSAAVLEDGFVHNRSYIFGRDGKVISHYDKVHGFSPAGENRYFAAGKRLAFFSIEGLACSMAICYDIRFPTFIRKERLQGVDLFFVPAAWPEIRNTHWRVLNKARAIENQMYLAAVNQCGQSGNTMYGGESMLLDPLGDSICQLEAGEEIAYGRIDTDVLMKVRRDMNVLADERKI